MSEPDADEVDPRRAFWRQGSYEILGDWIASASTSVLDRLVEVAAEPLAGRRLLDVATGTGSVAIEAAARGAAVVGVDVTDELLDIARRRADAAEVDVGFEVGDFDRLYEAVGDADFDVITSSFGVIFAPDPSVTLAGFERHLAADGLIGMVGWDPDGVFIVPESMLDLLPERPVFPDMGAWTTRITELCEGTPFEVASMTDDELRIPFASVSDVAEQLERWSGGWAQILGNFDALGVGGLARGRFRDHLASFATTRHDGIELRARYHVSVLRRSA